MTTVYDADRDRLPGLLIVEPDPQARDALALGMEAQGWQVWSVPDGAGAIETYERNRDRIDVALVDMQLPGLQGGRALAELSRTGPHLVRCAMSAHVNTYTANAFRRLSGTPLFTKPLDVPALAFALHDMLAPVGRS